jgi:hypothetical protein
MRTAAKTPALQQQDRAAAACSPAPSAAAVFGIDNRAEAIAQRELVEAIHNSAPMVTQRKQLRSLFGVAAQLQGRAEEEKPLQAKSGGGVIQREIKVGTDSRSVIYWATRLTTLYPAWNFEDTRDGATLFDGQSFDTMDDLKDWVEVEVERLGRDRAAARWAVLNYGVRPQDGSAHAAARHTAAGIWAAGRILTAHPDFVAVFRTQQDFQQALANMPTLRASWQAHPHTPGRYDAEVGGVHYQGTPLGSDMSLFSCYPTAPELQYNKTQMGLDLADAVDLRRFEEVLMVRRLANR